MFKQIFANPFFFIPVLVFIVYALFFHEFHSSDAVKETIRIENKVRVVEVPRLERSIESAGDTISNRLGQIKESIKDSSIGQVIEQKVLAPALKKKFRTSDEHIIASTLQGISHREIKKPGKGAMINCGDMVTVDLQGEYYDRGHQGKTLPAKFLGRKKIAIGKRQVVPGVERQLIGVRSGAEVLVYVPPAEGHDIKAFSDADIPKNSIAQYRIKVLDVAPESFKLRRPASYTEQKKGRGGVIGCGDIVKIKYVLFAVGVKDKKIISSADKNIKEFTLGAGEAPVGIEAGMVDMRLGGVRNIMIPADQLYTTSKKNIMPEVRSVKKGQGVLAVVILKEVNGKKMDASQQK
jgi:FKBP-type peptidyl-prolyl cis-trans isomerase 2